MKYKLINPQNKSKYLGNIQSDNKYQSYPDDDNRYLLKQNHNNYYLVSNSNNELFDYILACSKRMLQYILMKEERKKLATRDISLILRKRLPFIKRHLPDGTSVLLTYSHDLGYWVPITSLLNKIIVELDDLGITEITDTDRLYRQVLNSLNNIRDDKLNLIPYNPAPYYMIKFKNVVFNNKLKIPLTRRQYKDYHFIKAIDWNLKSLNEINRLYASISRHIINDWADGNEEVEHFIWQIIVSAIEGYGREKALIIKSDGGGGKTSFLILLQTIVGRGKVLACGLYELGNDNKLTQLNPDTHLIIGDDADTNKKMPPVALSRLKSLSDGGSFLIDVKYEASRPVMFDGLFIQNTNTDLAIYENNQALASRLMKLEWTNTNFREKKDDFDFDLKDLLGNLNKGIPANTEFIEAFISIAMFETKSFTKFDIPQSVTADTLSLLNENDQIMDYIEFLEQQDILQLPMLNLNTEYQRYVDRLKDINSSAKPLKKRNFSKDFELKLQSKGYHVYNQGNYIRPSALSLKDYNNEVINLLSGYHIDERSFNKTKFFIKESNKITESSVDNIKSNEQLDKFNPIHQQIYRYLSYELNDASVIEKFIDTMEN